MVNVLSLFQPLIGEVRRVGVRLALQNCILGHVESGVLWGDDDDWRSFLQFGRKHTLMLTVCSQSRPGLKRPVLSGGRP